MQTQTDTHLEEWASLVGERVPENAERIEYRSRWTPDGDL